MFDLFSWDWWQSLLGEHRLWIMFTSAFLSSTVLPGNSEIIFLTIATPLLWAGSSYFSADIQSLLWVAVIGNSLGSLTTYLLGRWLPPMQKIQDHRKITWVLEKTQRYGSLMLFFSWLPIVGGFVLCSGRLVAFELGGLPSIYHPWQNSAVCFFIIFRD